MKLPYDVNAKIRFLDVPDRDLFYCLPKAERQVSSQQELEAFCPTGKPRMFFNALHARPRQHKKKRWMSENYHKRIQKKWNKAFEAGRLIEYDRNPVVVSLNSETADKLLQAMQRVDLLGG